MHPVRRLLTFQPGMMRHELIALDGLHEAAWDCGLDRHAFRTRFSSNAAVAGCSVLRSSAKPGVSTLARTKTSDAEASRLE